MPSVTDQAIVIRRWDFSETSQTVSLLTREHGILRGLAKGAKREKADFSGGLDLLHEGEVVAIVKPGRDLSTLTAWHLQKVHRVLGENLAANRAAMYMADLVHHLLIAHDPHAAVFDALSGALALLDDDATRTDEALLTLQWCVLHEAGYAPELQRDARNGSPLDESGATLAFSASGGGVLNDDDDHAASPPPPDRWRVRRETIELLRGLAAGASLHEWGGGAGAVIANRCAGPIDCLRRTRARSSGPSRLRCDGRFRTLLRLASGDSLFHAQRG